ncbi:MAG: InlB B-repeat-containing protein, partial [Alphaproteobacteria bacterium]|nr:InlB B-repeat-containing protein [Alphaproteobacteria bacterium]
KQIGTICFLFLILIFPTFADNEPTPPTLIPASEPGCNQAVLNTTEGSAALEAIYTPNTITTQWYTGYGANASFANDTTCSYNGTINLPATNPSRPGYEFAGWRLKRCEIPATLTNVNGRMYGGKGDNVITGSSFSGDYNTYYFGLTEDQTWAVEYVNGDKLMGEASCNSTNGDSTYANNTYTNSSDWTAASDTMSKNDTGRYCWCRVTSYISSDGQQCILPDKQWVLLGDGNNEFGCAYNCSASLCANAFSRFTFSRTAAFSVWIAQ